MTVYLLFMGMDEFYVGLARGVSAIIGFIGASIYPYAKERYGLWNSGTFALIWQSFFVALAASSFLLSNSTASIFVLTIAVLISRIGLWLFDLCARQIAQETIKESVRGTINSFWQSIVNTFDLSAYAFTMVYSEPQQFGILSCISFSMVFSATLLFIYSSIYREEGSRLLTDETLQITAELNSRKNNNNTIVATAASYGSDDINLLLTKEHIFVNSSS